jgi:hypothetical protein
MRYEGLTLSYAIVARVGEREVARLSGPIAIEGLHSPTNHTTAVDCHLPAPIHDLAVGGRGRWLILHMPALRKLAVFDVVAGRIVHRLPLAEERVAFAAGLSKLLVVFPVAGVVQRWDLRTGTREATARLSMDGPVVSISMGSGSHGPLLVQWRPPGAGKTARWSLLDVDTFEASHLELRWNGTGDAQDPALASTDGKAFVMPQHRDHGSDGWQCLILGPEPRLIRGPGKSLALLGPDHQHVFTAEGMFQLDGTPIKKAPKASLLLPGTSGDYYLAATIGPSSAQRQAAIAELSVYVVGDDRAMAPIPSIDFTGLLRAQSRVLTVSKRIHFIPEASRIVTVPVGDNRLVLHSLNVQRTPAKVE